MESVRPDNSGMSVTQIKTKSKVDRCKEELENNPTPSQPGRYDVERLNASGLNLDRTNSSYCADDSLPDKIIKMCLKSISCMHHSSDLTHDCYNAPGNVLLLCYTTDQVLSTSESPGNEALTRLQADLTSRNNEMQPGSVKHKCSHMFHRSPSRCR